MPVKRPSDMPCEAAADATAIGLYDGIKRLRDENGIQRTKNENAMHTGMLGVLFRCAEDTERNANSLYDLIKIAPQTTPGNVVSSRASLHLAAHLGSCVKRYRQCIDLLTSDKKSIHSLPDEVLLNIFSHLDMNDALNCLKVSRRWRCILSDTPTAWVNKAVRLEGNLRQVDAQWKRLQVLSPGGRFRHIKIRLAEQSLPTDIGEHTLDVLNYWNKLQLSRNFPIADLETFTFTSSLESIVNELFWEHVSQCTRLKVLNWTSNIPYKEDSTNFPYLVSGTPLANCRLEEFRFNVTQKSAFDNEMAHILKEAKVIHLNAILGEFRVADIVEKAKETLEELQLVGTFNDVEEIEFTELEIEELCESMHSIEANRLKVFKARKYLPNCPNNEPRLWFGIQAPNLVEYSAIGEPLPIYVTLLQSCYKNLVKFECLPLKIITDDDFAKYLCAMPRCESFTIDWADIAEHEVYFWPSLVEPVRPGEPKISISKFLPKVKHLFIQRGGFPTFGDVLLKVVQSRSRLGLSAIESITLIDCTDITASQITVLRHWVPKVIVNTVPWGKRTW